MGSQIQDTDSVKPAQQEREIHLNQPGDVAYVRACLEHYHLPLLVEFCARGSRFTLCLVPPCQYVKIGYPDTGGPAYVLVGLWTMGSHGGFYAFDLGGYITVGYVMEKLRIKNETDAGHIAAFLMALGHSTGAEAYLANHVKLCPGRDYLDNRDPQET